MKLLVGLFVVVAIASQITFSFGADRNFLMELRPFVKNGTILSVEDSSGRIWGPGYLSQLNRNGISLSPIGAGDSVFIDSAILSDSNIYIGPRYVESVLQDFPKQHPTGSEITFVEIHPFRGEKIVEQTHRGLVLGYKGDEVIYVSFNTKRSFSVQMSHIKAGSDVNGIGYLRDELSADIKKLNLMPDDLFSAIALNLPALGLQSFDSNFRFTGRYISYIDGRFRFFGTNDMGPVYGDLSVSACSLVLGSIEKIEETFTH